MGRFTKDYMLHIGTAVFLVGVAVTAVSWANKYADPGALAWYDSILSTFPGQGERGQDWNIFFLILGPILLISGVFYAGEQVVLRRRFGRLLETAKKSEFASRRKDLDDLARRLPGPYRRRIEEKEATFRSLR